MPPPIYLDYNGTTPHAPEVIEAMRPFFETQFGNPSSSHWYGTGPKQAVEGARRQAARLINCRPDDIIFTSGGTESNNHAILGMARALRAKGAHLIASQIEHPAVLEVCRHLEQSDATTTYLPVDPQGRVSVADVAAAIRPDTILISIMHANNEVGTIQPIREISRIARQKGIVLHSDAAQSAGKIPVDVEALGVDLLSLAGHKIYAPKGVGALYVRHPLAPEKFCHGAGQENGRRAGTENVMEIVGFGKACELAAAKLEKNMTRMKALRDALHAGLVQMVADVRLNGHPADRLPNTLSLSFKGLEANRILDRIGREIAASAGAACHSDTVHVSHVLTAMSVPLDWAKGTVRFSLGRMTTAKDIEKTISVVAAAVKALRS